MDDRPATDPSEARVFENVITGLQKSYPREKMEEISTSFCFICLLHLANERGLKLETGAEEDTFAEEDRKIGNIWDLKVSTHRYGRQICLLTRVVLGIPRPRRRPCSIAYCFWTIRPSWFLRLLYHYCIFVRAFGWR